MEGHDERVEVPYAGCYYVRHLTDMGTCELRVPWQPNTFSLQAGLKRLGFLCQYDARYWSLAARLYSEETEAALRALLETGDVPPTPPQPERKRRRRQAAVGGSDDEGEGEEHASETMSFHGGLAKLEEAASGYVTLTGRGLENIRPMLTGILRFQLHSPGVWRSGWALNNAELAFVKTVLEHRGAKLQRAAFDDKAPLPAGCVVPPRFRPHDRAGRPLKGPCATRGGQARNLGRQYFSNFLSGAESGFIWADGTQAIGISAELPAGTRSEAGAQAGARGAGSSAGGAQRTQQQQGSSAGGSQRPRAPASEQAGPSSSQRPGAGSSSQQQHSSRQQRRPRAQPSQSHTQPPPGTPPKPARPPRAAAAAGGAAGGVQQEIDAQLQSLLRQSGHDYLRFVASLGVKFKPGCDKRTCLKRARQAALLQLHPDKLAQQGERAQARGLRATQMLNEMWQRAWERG